MQKMDAIGLIILCMPALRVCLMGHRPGKLWQSTLATVLLELPKPAEQLAPYHPTRKNPAWLCSRSTA